ncbi:reverse transcriptase domain-containing protein, partial [Acinetobacter baumannii]|uniref:reverse transcriptase domain-containing protein n=1 Tax=Acinetobacter baumannii TaxID=470 RepID=UPI00332649F9
NDVWEVVPRPEGKTIVGSRWLYKAKHGEDGSVEKFKAKFVAKGFSQIKCVDSEETFALVAKYSSIMNILALAA